MTTAERQKPLMVLLVGIPGSGKSTWCDRNRQYFRVRNKDEIREAFESVLPKSIKEREKAVDEMYKRNVLEACKHLPYKFEGVVLDNTFLNPKQRAYFKDLADQIGFEYVEQWMEDSLNVELCHKRNVARDRVVPHDVIEQMALKFIDQYFRETQNFRVITDVTKPNAIIVDIDGTIADMTGVRGPFEWDKVGGDKPIKEVIDVIKAMVIHNGTQLILMSGRDSVCRQKTEDWLLRPDVFGNIGGYDQLFMRKEGDMRRDVIVKYELFRDHVNGNYNITGVFDDRNQVVRLWRGLGFKTFQVAPGFI